MVRKGSPVRVRQRALVKVLEAGPFSLPRIVGAGGLPLSGPHLGRIRMVSGVTACAGAAYVVSAEVDQRWSSDYGDVDAYRHRARGQDTAFGAAACGRRWRGGRDPPRLATCGATGAGERHPYHG